MINNIDLSAGSMNNDINSSVYMSNIDSSVNSTNSDIQYIADVSLVSETKIVDIDITADQSSSGYVSKLTAFRFLDLEVLSAVVSSLYCCSTCNQASLSWSENFSRKKGLASALVIECSLCYYNKDFYNITKRNSKAFEVNVRSVYYCMKVCGRGYAGLEKSAAVMNSARRLTQNS